MKTKTRSVSGQQKMPNTQMFSLLDDKLIVGIRSWNGSEINQKILDEINHYMSSVEADLEVTSPFELSEHLSHIANKLKVSMLLANDLIYKSENSETYQHGAEVISLFKKNKEIAWASIGRFSIDLIKQDESKIKVFDSGASFNDEILMPVGLLGLMRFPDIHAGSFVSTSISSIEIKSIFRQQESVWECFVTDLDN